MTTTETEAANESLARIEGILGKPAFRADGIHIYHGDCLEMMRQIPGSPVALTVTSPPYNIGKEYESSRPTDDYLDWCIDWIREIHRLTTDTGAFWLNLGYFSLPNRAKAIPIPWLLWDRVPFFLIQEIIWNYGAGVAARKFFSPRNEKFLWYVKDADNYTFNLDDVRDPNVKYPNQKKNGKLKCNQNGKNPTDVWQIPKVTSGANRSSKERTPHPAQFPVAVLDRIIKACSNPGDLILDPFMGSGSVAEAGLRNGRPVIGFEIESKYISVARDRIRSFLRQQDVIKSQGHLF